jgi:hypothetical protein
MLPFFLTYIRIKEAQTQAREHNGAHVTSWGVPRGTVHLLGYYMCGGKKIGTESKADLLVSFFSSSFLGPI